MSNVLNITESDQILGGAECGLLAMRHEVSMGDLLWLASAADTESSRYALSTVAITRPRLVATDGGRMHFVVADSLWVADDGLSPPMHGSLGIIFLLPVAAIKAMLALVGRKADVTVSCYDNGRIILSDGWSHIMVKQEEGRYPNVDDYVTRPDVMVELESVADIRKACKACKEAASAAGNDTPLVEWFDCSLDARFVLDAIKPMSPSDIPSCKVSTSGGWGAFVIGLDDMRHAVIMPCEKD